MKTIITAFGVLLVCSQVSVAQETIGFTNPEATFHLEDYRLPDWGYDLFYLDLDGSYSSATRFNDSEQSSIMGRATPNYFFYRESEEMILSGNAQLPLELERSSNISSTDVESTASSFQTDLVLSGRGDYYVQDDIFATGQADINVDFSTETTDADNTPEMSTREADSRFNLRAGVGYGRVRNVTPVIRALRFNERLNVLNGGVLSDGQVQDLASVLAQRSGYASVYDRSNRRFWDDVSNVAPDMLGEMSLYDAYYLSETMLESTGQRYEGWDATGVLFVDHQRDSFEQEQNGTTVGEDDGSSTRYGLDLGGRLYHNLSLEQMLSARVNLGIGAYTESEMDDSQSLFQVGMEVGHLYNITDRLLVESAISNNYESIEGGDSTNRIFRINSTLTYFVEDNMSVSANLSYVTVNQEVGNFVQSRSNFGLNVSMRYFFLRSMS